VELKELIMANWSISLLEYNNDADKGVVIAHWRVTEEDGEYTASSYGTASFEPDASADGYVAYDSLTEETVIGWVKDSMDYAEVEAGLTANIEAQKTPATLAGMPWA
jgi:uncharacterized lipoprotein NlpE involved in copper resistance